MEENLNKKLNDPLADDKLDLIPKQEDSSKKEGYDYDLYEGSNIFSKLIFFWVLKILYVLLFIMIPISLRKELNFNHLVSAYYHQAMMQVITQNTLITTGKQKIINQRRPMR